MMRMSVWSSYYRELPIKEAIMEFKKHGVNATELSDEHGSDMLLLDNPIKEGENLRKFAEDQNFEISQGHLWLRCHMCSDQAWWAFLKRWIDMYEEIGIKNAVLHLDGTATLNGLSGYDAANGNIAHLMKIDEYLEKTNKKIVICLENLRWMKNSIEVLNYTLSKLGGSKHFGICLDTGHLNISEVNNQEDFIVRAGKNLRALHIADNQGKDDQHMIPFGRGNVDFEEVVRSLKKIGYDGLFNYEIPGESYGVPLEIRGYKLEYIAKGYEYLMNL